MSSELIGRAGVLAEIETDLRGGRSVIVIGAPGSGRTSVLNAVADALDSSVAVVRIAGADSASPLAAFVAVQTRAGRERAPELVAICSQPRSLIVVDDADRLDADSAAVVAAAMRAGTPLVAAAADLEAVPAALPTAHRSGAPIVRRLDPLTPRDAVRLAEATAGSALTPRAESALATLAEGNPLVVQLVVEASVAEGALVRRPQGWEAVRTLCLGPRLVAMFRPSLDGLPADAREAWAAVAAAGAIPAAAISTAELTELHERGLARLDVDHVVPVSALTAAAWCEGAAGAEIDRAVAAAMKRVATCGAAHSAPTLATLHLKVGAPLEATIALAEAANALAAQDSLRAAALAELGRMAEPSHALLTVMLGAATSASGDLDEAELHFEDAGRLTRSPAERVMLARARARHLGLARRDPAAAAELLDSLRADAEVGSALDWDVALWRAVAGMPASGPPQSAPDATALEELASAMFVWTIAGPLDAAIEGLRTFDALLPAGTPEPPTVAMTRLMVLAWSGASAAARQYAETALEGLAEMPEIAGAWDFTLAMLELTTRSVSVARRHAHRAVTRLSWRDPLGLSLASDALLRAALVAEAEAPLARAQTLTASIGELDPKVRMLRAWESAWVLNRQGRTNVAARELATEAHRLATVHGHPFLAAMLGHCIVSMGRPRDALAVLELVAAMAGGVGTLFRDYAAALDAAHTTGQWQPLEAVAEDFARRGMFATAIDIWAMRGEHSPRGCSWQERIAALVAESGAADADDLPTWRYHARGSMTLSVREREVAELAVLRLRSREIGERLGISARTVDKHLASVYDKLGVAGRSELLELSQPLATDPGR